MPEQIGLQAVLDMTDFNKGLKSYVDGTNQMDKSTATAEKSTKGFFNTIAGNIARGALEKAGHMFTQFVSELPQMAVEMYNLGAQVESTQYRFEAFAGGPDEAAEYLNAFTVAAGGAIDRMSAMQGASKLLQMGLVGNADEMELMAKIAVKLGDQTAQAGDRVNDFALLLANQSVMRLDNFGISSGKVRKRIEELQKATKDMSREEAFKIAVMEEGATSLERLGDTTALATTKTGNITAAFANLKQTAATMFLDMANDVEIFGKSIDDIPGALNWAERALTAWGAAQKAFWENGVMPGIDGSIDAIKEFDATMRELDPAMQKIIYDSKDLNDETGRYKNALDGINPELERYEKSLPKIETGISSVSYVTEDAKKATNDLVESNHDLMQRVMNVTNQLNSEKNALGLTEDATYSEVLAAKELVDANKKMEQSIIKVASAQLELGMSFTNYHRDVEQSAEEYAKTIEETEAEHQENLAKLTKKGQAWRKEIDLEAENEKLALLQQKLDLALLQQSEFSEKTKESTKIAKAQQIATLQAQLAEQTALIESANNGYIVMQGANVAEDLALENERYAEKLRLAQEAYALEREEQRRHLGEMILQSFDAWVAINGGVTEQTLLMRTRLAEEYGLVDENSTAFVASMLKTFDDWKTNQNVSTDAVISRLDTAANSAFNLKTAIENLPSSKEIVITYTEQGGREASRGGTGPKITEYAEGGTSRGGMAMVGERGPELVNLPHGAQVMNTTDTAKLFKTVSMMLQSNTPVSQIMNNQKSINVPINATINNGMDMFAFQSRVREAVAGAL